jgi:hypothetical protein
MNSTVARVSGSKKERKNFDSDTMLVERDCSGTRWLY